jgi:mono/diheme cytochrome c family protein
VPILLRTRPRERWRTGLARRHVDARVGRTDRTASRCRKPFDLGWTRHEAASAQPGITPVVAGARDPGMVVASESSMKPSLPITMLAAALVTPLGAGALAAEQADPGRAMYLRYCGACHGPQGKGDGLAGSFMTPKPADLTQIAKKNGGTFPFQGVMAYIDGTKEVRAHGDPVMPVWGEIFLAESTWDMGRRAEVQGKLMLITDHVRSIQAR